MPDVRELQREGLLGGREGRGVRAEGGEHALHGEPVLFLVFRALGEGEGRGDVAVGIAAARGGAGQDPGGDRAAGDRDERLGAGADEAVDREDPAVRVPLEERADQAASIGSGGDRADDVARQHDLADVAHPDRLDRPVHGLLISLRGLPPGTERGRPVRAEGGAGRQIGFGFVGGVGEGQSRDPGPAAVTSHDRAGHPEDALALRAGVEDERAEGHESRAGQAQRVVDLGGGGDPAPPVGDARVARSGTGVADRQQIAEAGERLATSAPEQGVVARRVVEHIVHGRQFPGDDAQTGHEVVHRLLHLSTVDRH